MAQFQPLGFVTLRIGITAVAPVETQKPEILIKATEETLYRAKELGRNRAEAHLSASTAASQWCVQNVLTIWVDR